MAERVYTYVDYFDRPLSGAADFEGRPHWYRCSFDEASDDYRPEYQLTPLPDEILSAELERQGIFLEWHEAYKAGRAGRISHPALPEKRTRHDELTAQIESFLANAEATATVLARWVHENGELRVVWENLDG